MARNIAATNAGVGQASVTTRIKLTIQAAKKCLFFGALPMFVAPMAYWVSAASPQEYDVAKLEIQRLIADDTVPRKWRMRDSEGTRRIISVLGDTGIPIQYIRPKDLPAVMREAWEPANRFRRTFWCSLLMAGIGYIGIWQLFVYRGKAQQSNRRIRGAYDIVDAQELDKLVRAKAYSAYRLAGVHLPADAPMRGILAIGAQGSGKSVAIHDFMQQVFANKRKCVTYDQSGEFFRADLRLQSHVVSSESTQLHRYALAMQAPANVPAQAIL